VTGADLEMVGNVAVVRIPLVGNIIIASIPGVLAVLAEREDQPHAARLL
jgi:hypothetical protein